MIRPRHSPRTTADSRPGTAIANAQTNEQPRRASGAGFGYGPELLDEMTQVKVVHLEMPPEAG